MIRAYAPFVRKLSLLFLLLLPGACHLTNLVEEGTLHIVGDSAWTAHDRTLILLQDGRGSDTLFDGRLPGLDTLSRLPAGGYAGGQALFIIQGFLDGELVFEEHRSYDGSRQKVVAIDVLFDLGGGTASPDMDLRPDQVRLYLGGGAATLEVFPASLPANRTLAWKTGNPQVATVSKDGVISPVGTGATYVQVAAGDLRDASSVRVVRDIPVVDAGAPDTTVPAGSAVTFHVTVTQEYGDVAAFAWDLNGDDVFDDSVAGAAGQTRFATPSRTFGTGEVKVRFRVRDGEGNTGEAAKLVEVAASAPKIDSLGAEPLVVSIKDNVAFAALAAGSGADLRAFAWDFDGDGTDEKTGSLQGEKATVAGVHAYPEPATYRARLRVEDANSVAISAEVSVTVKLDRPVADAGTHRTASPGAQVRLQGLGTDTLGEIVSREWKCGPAGFVAAGDSGVHVFTAPSEAGSTACVFRVTDDDGLSAEDTLRVSVDELDAPSIPSFTPADTTVSIRDSVAFLASAAAGTADLKAYRLDIDGDGTAELQGALSGRAGQIRAGRRFPSAGTFDVTLTVEDQGGKTARSSARIRVLLDPPKAGAGKDTTVEAGTRVNLRGTASDSLGTVVLREWKIGSGAFARVAGGDTSFTAPATGTTLTCTFKVTDDDGQSAEDIVEVTVSASRIADLASLTISTGNLVPEFSAQAGSYSVSVPNATTSLTVTPKAAHPNATLLVNGKPVASGSASAPINLTSSTTEINILVTAQDTAVKQPYTVTVNRAASANAELSSLTPSTGALDPEFSAATANYSVSVTAASIRLTPTAAATGATILVNGATVASGAISAAIDLIIGANPIPVKVTAPDGATTKTYTVNVTRISTDASLATLAFPGGGSLDRTFSPEVTTYTVTATAAMSAFSVRPTAAAAGATLTVDGTAVSSGQQSADLAFPIGRSSHSVVVTAPDRVTQRTYNLTVIRPVPQSLRFGYALVDSFTASHDLTANVHNPAGKVEFVRSGTGTYTLHFRGLATLGGGVPGIVHATAHTDGTVGAYCKVVDWTATSDLTARIACFTMGGAAADAKVSVLVLFPRNGTAGHNAIAWADQHTRTLESPYEPDTSRSYSSGGPITITRRLTGEYSVQFAGLGGTGGGAPMVTAVGAGSVRCQITDFNGTGADMAVNVRCMTAGGPAADAQFNLSVMQPYTGTADGVAVARLDTNGVTSYAFNNGGGSISLAHEGPGQWQVTLVGLASRGGSRGGNVQVAIRYSGTVACQTGGWTTARGTDLLVKVKCFDVAGTLVDRAAPFMIWVLK